MKLLKQTTAFIALAFITLSFTVLDGNKKTVDVKASTVTWKGYKVTGSHTGEIAIKSGYLTFDSNALNGGEFVIDMPSITVTDLEGKGKANLEGHLKSDDFFGVNAHPEATLKFTNVKATGKGAYKVTGDVTIKGKTESITFDMTVDGNKANAALKLDRTKFDVKYGSASFFDNLKDKAINDEFDITVNLELK
jgi:polyisoprenoid-binding protein YceI